MTLHLPSRSGAPRPRIRACRIAHANINGRDSNAAWIEEQLQQQAEAPGRSHRRQRAVEWRLGGEGRARCLGHGQQAGRRWQAQGRQEAFDEQDGGRTQAHGGEEEHREAWDGEARRSEEEHCEARDGEAHGGEAEHGEARDGEAHGGEAEHREARDGEAHCDAWTYGSEEEHREARDAEASVDGEACVGEENDARRKREEARRAQEPASLRRSSLSTGRR